MAQLPQTEQELRSILQNMQAQGAPKQQMKILIDDFVQRQAQMPIDQLPQAPVGTPPEATQAVLQRGGTISDEKITVEEPKEKGFVERTFVDPLKESFQETQEIEQAVESGETGRGQALFQQLGSSGGALTNIAGNLFMEGLKGLGNVTSAVVPDAIEQPVKEAAGDLGAALLRTEKVQEGLQALQDGMERFEQWKQENPNAYRNARTVFTTLEAIPAVVGTKLAKEGAEVGIEKGAQATAATGRALEQSAQKTFRQQAEEIVTPELEDLTKRQREARFGDIVETSTGGRTVTPNLREQQAIDEVSRLLEEGKFKAGDSTIKKGRAINEEIGNLSNTLDEQLKATASENVTRGEVNNIFQEIRNELSDNITIVGDAEKSVDKLLGKVDQLIGDKESLSAFDLIDIRRKFDNFVRQQKGDAPLSPETQNALSQAVRQVRNTLNDKAADLAQDVEVKKLLRQQSALFTAQGTIANQFARESAGRLGRTLQKIQNSLGIPKSEIIETLGFLGLGASAGFATGTLFPAIAASILVQQGGKRLFAPQLRQSLGKLLQKVEKSKGDVKIKNEIKEEINNLIPND